MARLALRRRIPSIYIACVHAQQCAEKCLKAALVSRGESFPKTHDLITLNALCVAAGISLPLADPDLALLSTYAVQARYPDWLATVDDARGAVETASVVRRYARKLFGLK